MTTPDRARWLQPCPTEWGHDLGAHHRHRCTNVDSLHAGDHLCDCGATSGWPILRSQEGPQEGSQDEGHIPADERARLEAEIIRLRALVGEEGQPDWDNCSRAEAIRQAEEKHAELWRYIGLFEKVRDERDEARERLADQRAKIDAALRDQDAFTNWWKTCDVSRLTAGHLGDMYADYLADTLGSTREATTDIPCQVYRPGPHGQRLCVRTLRDKPPCCFPTTTTDRTPA